MEETQDILLKMGFKNTSNNVWHAEWFGHFILHSEATPKQLAEFIFRRAKTESKCDDRTCLNMSCFWRDHASKDCLCRLYKTCEKRVIEECGTKTC